MGYNGSVAIITNPKGEYLLQLRDANAPTSPNEWGFFGGHAEKGEAPLETLIRELNEELGLSFDIERFEHVDMLKEPDENGAALIALYRLSLAEGEQDRIRLGEGAAFRFFTSKDEVLKLPVSPWQRGVFEKFL